MKNEYEVRGEVTTIFLKRKDGEVIKTIIDTSDLDKVKNFSMTWYASWDSHTKSFYCFGNEKAVNRKQRKIKLHRYLFDFPDNIIDHKNGDTLDNRRSNLRITDFSGNAQNRTALDSTNKSGIRGVSWSEFHQKWTVTIRCRGKTYYFGRFVDKEEAKSMAEKQYEILYNNPKLP